jgi:hypothetical protein
MKQRSTVPQPEASISSSNYNVVAPVRNVNNILITMRKVVIEIIAALLVLLFLYASVSKLLGFSVFVDEMNNQPFPNWMTPYLVVIIPGSEILIALALLFDRTRMFGFYASLVILFLFTLYAALVLMHVFDYVPCSCGGMLKKLNWSQHLLFTLAFLILSLAGLALYKRQRHAAFHRKAVSM